MTAAQKQEHHRKSFIADVERLCRIYKLVIEPGYFAVGNQEEAYLAVQPLRRESDLYPLRGAL